MKRLGFGLVAAGMMAAATFLMTLPSNALGLGGGASGSAGEVGTAAVSPDLIIPVRGGGGGFGGDGMIFFPPMGGGGMGPGGWHGGGPGSWHGGGPGWNGNPWHGNNWHGNGWNNWYGNGYYHGPRYRWRYPGYNYYYGGYWYPWAWWTFNGGYGNNHYAGGGGKAHVRWCMNRYRSYNPRTNTYTGHDGRQHRCNSPYD